ncbi:MAG: helix-turn-helix domain-containing protein [Oscillatoria sp. PMC 1051.18]|nr:helix-turn-helix domain-containing protein [Oscillatoria sp. PMC 1051.18]
MVQLQQSEQALHRWEKQGLTGLWDAPRSGRKKKWMAEDIAVIEQKLDTEARAYSSHQLCNFLKNERKINLSERHLRRILKKKL